MDSVLHQLPVVKGYSTRTPSDKIEAARVDKVTHATLRALREAESANKCCADCTASLTGWASLPHGVFLCIACAQVHRSLGRHMAQVKSFSSGTYLWYPDEVDAMRQMGNAKASLLYTSACKGAPAKPDEHASAHTKEQFIRNKYERLKWVDPTFSMSKSHAASSSSSSSSSSSKGKGRTSTTITKTPSLQRRQVTSKSTKLPTTFDPSLWDMVTPTLPHAHIVTGQPSPTSPSPFATTTASFANVKKGRTPKHLLDDDQSNALCKASVMPPMRGITALTKSCSQSYSARATAAMRGGSTEDFFASWGL